MSYKIFKAIQEALKAVPGIVTVVSPGEPNKSSPDALYGTFTHHPNTPTVFTLGDEGDDEATGFSQLLLRYPINKGSGDIQRMGDLITKHFKAGQRKFFEGQEVVIVSSGSGRLDILEGQLVLPITINWYALVRRYENG